jgi:uncharacterized protein YfbU (UPF0304 family)
MKISLNDRIILANQYRILELLDQDSAGHHSNLRKALEDGYTLHYKDLAGGFGTELGEEECREVISILQMYRALSSSYEHLTDKGEISPQQVEFPGFDGNDETKQFSYAGYLVDDLGNWREFQGRDLNSHFAMLPRYRNMLGKWLPLSFETTLDRV